MAATTLADLIAAVADAFGKYRSGTADANTSSDADELIDAAVLVEPDDAWVGHYLYVLEADGAAPEGEERPITDFDQASHTLTVSPAFSAALAAGDTYEILPLRRETIKRAINQAIQLADAWYQHVVNTSVTLAEDDYDYDLSAFSPEVVSVAQVWVQDASDEAWEELDSNQWRVGGAPGAKVLYLDSFENLETGKSLRIEYVGRLDKLSADDDTLGLDESVEGACVKYVIAYALHWLYVQAASEGPSADVLRSYITLADYQRGLAEQIRQRAGGGRPAGRMHGPAHSRSRG